MTDEQLSAVFRAAAEKALQDWFPEQWDHWVDSATEGIPFYYAYTHYGLSLVYAQLGRQQAADEHYRRAEQFLRLGNRRREN